jgi:hypothetical protein
MKLPTIQGLIKRRILVNFRADPAVIQNILPKGFRPKLHKGKAIAGICLIRLEHIRPKFTPEFVGINSENAAHRIAVHWEDESGTTCEGVFIPRRDTGSTLNSFTGGRVFPGEHHKAGFEVKESGNSINFAMRSDDGTVTIDLTGKIAAELPSTSIFSSLDEASKFFEPGELGYSVTRDADHLDGLLLKTKEWRVEAFELDSVESSFYNDEMIFPKGSIEFDHALLMRDIEHEWHAARNFDL